MVQYFGDAELVLLRQNVFCFPVVFLLPDMCSSVAVSVAVVAIIPKCSRRSIRLDWLFVVMLWLVLLVRVASWC